MLSNTRAGFIFVSLTRARRHIIANHKRAEKDAFFNQSKFRQDSCFFFHKIRQVNVSGAPFLSLPGGRGGSDHGFNVNGPQKEKIN